MKRKTYKINRIKLFGMLALLFVLLLVLPQAASDKTITAANRTAIIFFLFIPVNPPVVLISEKAESVRAKALDGSLHVICCYVSNGRCIWAYFSTSASSA